MIIELDRTGTVDALGRILERTAGHAGVRSLLVLAADGNGFTPAQVDPILTRLSLPVFGGIFPEILHGTEHLPTGTLVLGLAEETCVEVIPGLSDDHADYEQLIDEKLASCPHHGTGLGLAISKRLVEKMDGEIGLVSEEGRGSTFSFSMWLPESPAGHAPPPDDGGGHAPRRASEAAAAQVLLVEDNDVNRLVGQRMLEKLGYGVRCVGNGVEAIAAVGSGRYDLVLMDCQMPKMDGFEATQTIRAREDPVRRIPIIALTASAMESDRARCHRAGMDDFMSKPIKRDDLANMIAKWLVRCPAAPLPR